MITEGVVRARLANGLSVLLKEVHAAPVGSVWVWYRVGSRHDPPGRTGASHWVEHMMFRGTERFPQGVADRLISRVGGYSNAMTYLDWTAYFATLPAAELDLALEIEADRMANARFEPEEVEVERTVIISERQGMEGSPVFHLHEAVHAAAFAAGGYRHHTIGSLADLQAMTAEDLARHYRRYYNPQNATLVVVGDFEAQAMLGRIERAFGHLASRPIGELSRAAVEPPVGETVGALGRAAVEPRRVQLTGPEPTAYVMAAYQAPPATHPDFFPAAIADTLLGGPRSLALFDDGGPARTARLSKALVDTGLASDVSSFLLPTVDPYLLIVLATVQAGRQPEEVEAALLAEVERLAREPVSADELRRAVHQARAQFAYSAESVTDQAYWLGFSQTVADLGWLEGFLPALAAVTAEDVQRVAAAYLTSSRCLVGVYRPQPRQ
ncbi:MAG: insulinase family protein [Caldilineales bacterium]|nr:insulinase family protein [Caldilineales bacterium]